VPQACTIVRCIEIVCIDLPKVWDGHNIEYHHYHHHHKMPKKDMYHLSSSISTYKSVAPSYPSGTGLSLYEESALDATSIYGDTSYRVGEHKLMNMPDSRGSMLADSDSDQDGDNTRPDELEGEVVEEVFSHGMLNSRSLGYLP
jgi:hypothetical protein